MARGPFLIVGLGNPGPEYAFSHHNAGWMLVDRFAASHDIPLDRVMFKGRIGSGTVVGEKVYLVKPLTYMNASGQSVIPLLHYYKIPLKNLLVCYDEMDLPLGTIRLRTDGGAGGQKGMVSIIQAAGSNQFPRLRLGVGRPPPGWDPADYLLSPFTQDELPVLKDMLDRALPAVELFISEGIQAAMNRFNAGNAPKAAETK
ncbi:MAG: aminoacyl-tRNA hydrolase [Chloroflexi bacterium]|nr:aminoacyl-tRNA hydrolase [Chloroflexota bacterium]